MARQRVIVGMSGGGDSSVAPALLVEQGYEVVGVTMRLWTLHDGEALPGKQKCCSVEDVDDAVAVAQELGIPHYVMNFERQFQENVVDYFVAEYARGRTPNPCLACNEFIKYRTLLERAVALDADYLATGHYARVLHRPDRHRPRLPAGAAPLLPADRPGRAHASSGRPPARSAQLLQHLPAPTPGRQCADPTLTTCFLRGGTSTGARVPNSASMCARVSTTSTSALLPFGHATYTEFRAGTGVRNGAWRWRGSG